MRSPETGDEYREINQHECQEFVDAVENLEEFWEWGIGDDPALWEEIYGPENDWSEQTQQEFADRQSFQSSYFKIDEAGTFVYKQIRNNMDLESAAELKTSGNSTHWGASIDISSRVGDTTVSVSSQLQVEKAPDKLYVPSFIQWERFQLPDGTFTARGRSPAEQDAIDKMDIARKPNAGGWEQPPDYWDALGDFNDAVAEITRKRKELEEITGIDTRRFTKTKLDEIMQYLGAAGADNFVPDTFS